MVSCQMFATTSQSIPTAQKFTISNISTLEDKVYFIWFAVFQRAIAKDLTMILLKSRV